MRIDGHQHFWTTQRDDYGWLTPELELLYKDFGPEDLQPLLDQAGVDRTVLVQGLRRPMKHDICWVSPNIIQ